MCLAPSGFLAPPLDKSFGYLAFKPRSAMRGSTLADLVGPRAPSPTAEAKRFMEPLPTTKTSERDCFHQDAATRATPQITNAPAQSKSRFTHPLRNNPIPIQLYTATETTKIVASIAPI